MNCKIKNELLMLALLESRGFKGQQVEDSREIDIKCSTPSTNCDSPRDKANYDSPRDNREDSRCGSVCSAGLTVRNENNARIRRFSHSGTRPSCPVTLRLRSELAGRAVSDVEGSTASLLSGRAALGSVVSDGTSSFELLLAFEACIYHAIADNQVELRAPAKALLPKDFKSSIKVSTTIGETVYKCKIYAPQVFGDIRNSLFNIGDADFFASVGVQNGSTTELSTTTMGSKSRQKFFVSKDGRFFIKTISSAEAVKLIQILPDYFQHMKANPNSLLCRYLGLFRIKPRKRYLIVMANVLDTSRDVHERYDLKGSMLGRLATEEEKKNPRVVLKDIDFIMNHRTILVGKDRKKQLVRQIERDTDFLRRNKLMDYSLFIGIHKRTHIDDDIAFGESNKNIQTCKRGNEDEMCVKDVELSFRQHYLPASCPIYGTPSVASQVLHHSPSVASHSTTVSDILFTEVRRGSLENHEPEESHVSRFQQHDGGFSSVFVVKGKPVPGEHIIFLGIIDLLQEYNAKKKTESIWKRLFNRKNTLSCVEPQYYADRFRLFAKSIFQ